MRVLTSTDLACLKSTPSRLSVECKIAEPRVSDKLAIIVCEKMSEEIANSDCIWFGSYKVSSSSREKCWKGMYSTTRSGSPQDALHLR